MGFFFRKSFRIGPIRLNLSKSGLGASAGIKGLRVGASPKGPYVHAGRSGFYYRKQLGGAGGGGDGGGGATAAPSCLPILGIGCLAIVFLLFVVGACSALFGSSQPQKKSIQPVQENAGAATERQPATATQQPDKPAPDSAANSSTATAENGLEIGATYRVRIPTDMVPVDNQYHYLEPGAVFRILYSAPKPGGGGEWYYVAMLAGVSEIHGYIDPSDLPLR